MEFSRRAALKAGGAALVTPLVGRASAHPEPYEPRDSVAVEGATEAVVGPDGTTIFLAATTGFAVVDASDPTDLTVSRSAATSSPTARTARSTGFTT